MTLRQMIRRLDKIETDVNAVGGILCLVFILNLGQCAQQAFAQTPEIAEAAMQASRLHNIDYDLIMAIIQVESNFNQYAQGGLNERGLLQLRPEFHPAADFTVHNNIRVGVQYLSDICSIHCSRFSDSWFVFFNHGPYRKLKAPKKTRYYKRVKKALDEKIWSKTLIAGGR